MQARSISLRLSLGDDHNWTYNWFARCICVLIMLDGTSISKTLKIRYRCWRAASMMCTGHRCDNAWCLDARVNTTTGTMHKILRSANTLSEYPIIITAYLQLQSDCVEFIEWLRHANAQFTFNAIIDIRRVVRVISAQFVELRMQKCRRPWVATATTAAAAAAIATEYLRFLH